MRRIITGQLLLIVCCMFYLVWWYRGYRPGASVSRIGGINGVLLLLAMAFGVAGAVFSLTKLREVTEPRFSPFMILTTGILAYLALFLITRVLFHRVVTTELLLIVAWTALEITVIDRLFAGGFLTNTGFVLLCIVIAAALLLSLVLYVAYYRMEDRKAFYAAMVPLVTEAAAMGTVICAALRGSR